MTASPSLFAVAVVSVPEFLVATLAVLVFAVKLHWLPALSSIADVHSLSRNCSAASPCRW